MEQATVSSLAALSSWAILFAVSTCDRWPAPNASKSGGSRKAENPDETQIGAKAAENALLPIE